MSQPSFRRRVTPILLATALLCALAVPVSATLQAQPEALSVSAFSKSTTIGHTVTFSPDDFRISGEGTLDAIRITSLPDGASGVLTLGAVPLAPGDLVTMSAVSGMKFSPLAAPTAATAEFTFSPIFQNGTVGESVTVGLYLLTAENHPPVAQDMQVRTFKNVSFIERFRATDPEGDLLTFQLADKPARGAITISDTDPYTFVYTPYENKTGKDSFTFVAIDTVGNTSQPATVKIEIVKAKTKVTYADMAGDPAYNAALTLAERGILIGECMNGQYYFNAALPVSRDQFTALAMSAMELPPLENISYTGFFDDTAIPTWAKGYVSSALKSGVVQGYPNSDNNVVFAPGNRVTRGEASVILNRLLAVTDVDASATFYSDVESVPTWALQSAANLETVGVLQTDSNGALCLSDTLTRGDAARLIASALAVADARDQGGFFHW
ncbi:MAG: S-layer homology domain-containing protein [Oscillospiraceae bacterium]